MSTERGSVERDVIDVETEPEESSQVLVREDPRAILAEFEATAALIPKLVAASISVTKPQDWIAVGEKVYLQGTGMERIASLWGLIFGEPEIIREDYPDGEYAYSVTGPVGCRKTGVFYKGVTGGRSSRDPFFDQFDEPKPDGFRDLSATAKAQWREAHRIKPDPMEVRKAAVTNWQTRSGSMVAGMRGLTVADLESNGIRGVKEIEYGTGTKGGDTAPAEVKTERMKLANELLKRVGGDKEAAKKLLREITASKNFKGFDSTEAMKLDWQFSNAWKALKAHKIFVDEAKEPGSEG